LIALAAAATSACFLVACESADNPAQSGDVGSKGSSSGAPSCSTPAAGCPCNTPGQAVACGQVVQTSGGYVTCSEGTQTCNGATWGECVGQYTTTHALPAPGDLQLQGLNPSTPCQNDPCDPRCNTFIDNSTGLDAGVDTGITINDSGVTLTGHPVSTATCTSLQITPNTSPAKDLTVTTMAPSPNTVQYTASILPPSCYAGTPSFLWSIDKYDLAQVSSSGLLTLAVPIAGPITVSAYAGTLSASVVCNVTVNVVDTSGAPTGYSNAQFPTTTGTTDHIAILYPYANTVFPLGLPSPLIQWRNNSIPATTANAVKVTLRFPATSPIFSWSEIVPELQTAPTPTLAAQPRATIPQSVWQDFQQTVVRNSGATGGDAVFAVQRTVGGTLMTEVPTTIHFANGQLKGNIFYNSYGTNLVQNFGPTLGGAAFGAATLEVAANATSPTVIVGYNDPSESGAGCRVCHNASSSGNLILSNSYLTNGNSGGGSEATTFTYNPTLATPALIQGSEALIGTTYGTNTFTYAAPSPDGTYLFTSAAPSSANGASALYTTAGASITSNVPAGLHAATPTFSPDAAHVAFNFYSGSASPLAAKSGDGQSLAMMDFVPPKTFSNFRVLETPSSLYSVWPSFLPPGQNGIVYQNEITSNYNASNRNPADWGGTRSQCDSTAACNNVGATGELWWVSTGTTPVATRLTNMNGGTYLPRSTLNGTLNVHNNSASVTTSASQVGFIVPGALLEFASQAGSYYAVSSVSATTIVLTSNYSGTTNASTTAVANYHGTSSNDAAYYEEVYNYEPTALPITIGGYSWVAFTSRRLYGNVATIDPFWSDPRYQNIATQPTAKKIWVAAISNSPTAGTDPSFPAFYLPGQELLAGNARAYFTLAACEAPGAPTTANLCTSNLDCCGGTATPPTSVCQLDPPPLANPPTSHCVATSASSCVADGSSCTSDAQCCNFASGSRCGSGTCNPTPPIDTYGSTPFVTTYQSSCPVGQYPAWRFFYWETITPTGTSIAFQAATSTNGTTWGAPVSIGTAAPPPVVTSTWTSGPQTVDQALRANNQVSAPYLEIIATLVPDPTHTVAPTLTNWQLTYDCVDSE
jgi:hypothetical protein